MAEFLRLERVTVVRGGVPVLRDVSLRVREGERIAILGPNGCGKSTLIKTITRELYPLAGPETVVEVFGRERWDVAELKRRLGVVQNELPGESILRVTGREAVLTGFFSSAALWPHLVVTEAMERRAGEVLEQVGGAGLAGRLVGEMSAGQQRRVMIGRALVASAGCLLLDEPSNALDLAAQRDLRGLLVELAERGTTLLHITHHIADIIPAVDRVVFLREGRVVADGAREELLTEARLGELFGTRVHLTEQDGFFHAW